MSQDLNLQAMSDEDFDVLLNQSRADYASAADSVEKAESHDRMTFEVAEEISKSLETTMELFWECLTEANRRHFVSKISPDFNFA